MIKKYKKKPVVIEAVQLIDGCGVDMEELFETTDVIQMLKSGKMEVAIQTLEGVMMAQEGDFIIKGVKGELYPCKPDIFKLTYEPLPEPPKERG